ncbi:putative histidine kinase HHK17p [Cucurbitaria berberidis CBS 394.84]|uniref:histidine kinase n=1 Tax=Cucurbitaria berberidis CBS 394.84 TaxID=1168544 RepID=A0A9P4GIN9_9PLEO|nr:putative histidine kinase HHK17p [Cucurbitaria berberidis CBS 394.84]KAF1846012.1 putative histidine kinase HHK17p [Cucurbitaria berberidis CBS 394.84]
MAASTAIPPDIIERQSLCFSRPMPGMVVQQGESGFKEELSRIYDSAESNAAEQFVQLKDTLRKADTESFWGLLTKGLASIADAQYAFVSKRILVDDKDVAVELPPIGEPGACLMGEAFYINDDHNNGPGHLRNFKYHAYSCPCAYMKHDKILVIPERLNDFIVNNPNDLIIPGEAYLGIPLFAEGKCFAHFGVMWGKEGAARRVLGWGFLEMLFHGLEDLILERVLGGSDFASSAQPVRSQQPVLVPHEAVSVAQSLKPYARSLSHELRTPMQGVVGMLDVMMANVKEASETLQIDPRTRQILETLKDNIEAVQDSSRRAVEAADNVVHAYDMNMGVPETPLSPLDKTPEQWNAFWHEMRPDLMITGNGMPRPFRGIKRRRDEVSWADVSSKARVSRQARVRIRGVYSDEARISGSLSCPPDLDMDRLENACSHGTMTDRCDSISSPMFASEHSKVPGLRHTNVREVLQYVINDALKVGGRPDSAIAEATDTGERIEVRTRGSNGDVHTKWIEWTVSPDVPETILIDERDLAKMVSCLALNAIKFTHDGSITLQASLSAKSRYIVINITDTGSGIPPAFLPNLFKPFAREDDSTTRQSEGLGLGLMVAKGIARKLGGDLLCVRSHVSGPGKGSEFEMRVPLSPGELCSRPSTPFGSPSPSVKSRMSVDPEVARPDFHHEPVTPPLSSDSFKTEGERRAPITAPDTPLITIHSGTPPEALGMMTPRYTSSPPRPSKKRAASSEPDAIPADLAQQLPLNFLVVDDNAINRKVLVNMLARLGYKNVTTAFNGNDAVECMRRNAQGPASAAIDVVLMDLWMPLLDGFQASETILSMPEFAHERRPTILAVSADITDAALEKAVKSGMKGFITKPFVTRDIARLIRSYCASR